MGLKKNILLAATVMAAVVASSEASSSTSDASSTVSSTTSALSSATSVASTSSTTSAATSSATSAETSAATSSTTSAATSSATSAATSSATSAETSAETTTTSDAETSATSTVATTTAPTSAGIVVGLDADATAEEFIRNFCLFFNITDNTTVIFVRWATEAEKERMTGASARNFKQMDTVKYGIFEVTGEETMNAAAIFADPNSVVGTQARSNLNVAEVLSVAVEQVYETTAAIIGFAARHIVATAWALCALTIVGAIAF